MILLLLMLILQDNSAENEADGWITVEPPRIGAKIQMPSRPVFSEQKIKPVQDQEEITIRSRSVMLSDGKASLIFLYHDEHETPGSKAKVNAILNGAVTGAIALVNGELVKQNEIFLKTYKGRDFVYKCELDDAKYQVTHKMMIRSRVILVRNRLFAMNYIAEEDDYDDKIANRFFKSFELVNNPGDAPPKPRPGRARELEESRSVEDSEQEKSW